MGYLAIATVRAEPSTAKQYTELLNYPTANQYIERINSTFSQNRDRGIPQPVTTRNVLPTASHYTEWITHSQSLYRPKCPQPVNIQTELSHSPSVHGLNYPYPVTTYVYTELPVASHYTDWITCSKSLHRLNYPTASHYRLNYPSQSPRRLHYPHPVTMQTELPKASHYTDWITHSQSLLRLNYLQSVNIQT